MLKFEPLLSKLPYELTLDNPNGPRRLLQGSQPMSPTLVTHRLPLEELTDRIVTSRAAAMASPNWRATITLLLLSLLQCCRSAPAFLRAHKLNGASSYVTQEPLWFSQRIDHFQSQDRRVFSQRYYQFLDHFHHPSHAPIFLRICGEGTCGGIANDYLAVRPSLILLRLID